MFVSIKVLFLVYNNFMTPTSKYGESLFEILAREII